MVHYRIAMASKPTVKEAFWAMGRLLSQHGKWTEAQEAYNALLAIEPDNFSSHCVWLPSCLIWTERRSRHPPESALQTRPVTPEDMNDLAWDFGHQRGSRNFRDGVQAVQYAKRACETDALPGNRPDRHFGGGLRGAGRFDEADGDGAKSLRPWRPGRASTNC